MSLSYLTGAQPVPGKVTPLISGSTYITQLVELLHGLESGDKVYLHNWFISPNFFYSFQGSDGIQVELLLNRLHELVAKGVDVRVMLWVNSNLFEPFYPIDHHSKIQELTEPGPGEPDTIEALAETWRGTLSFAHNKVPGLTDSVFHGIMLNNLVTADIWRKYRLKVAEDKSGLERIQDAALASRIVLNTLDSTMGGCHSKFALILKQDATSGYVGTAFTGGIDFAINRLASPPYKNHTSAEGEASLNYWHDIMARVEGGDIIQSLHDYYRKLWNDNRSRFDTYNPFITAYLESEQYFVEAIPPDTQPIEDLSSAITAPSGEHWVQSVFTVPKTYQLLGSPQNPMVGEPEIASYPNGHFSLRQSVYHLIQEAQHYLYIEDQGMQSLELWEKVIDALKANDQLRIIMLTGGDPADAQDNVSRKLVRWLYYDDLSVSQRERLYFLNANYTIHSKLFLADDAAAIIGSGGFFTRSMTEEHEHSIAFVDETAPSIADFRKTLWKIHIGIDFEQNHPNLADAADAWNDSPFPAPQATDPPDLAFIEAIYLSEDQYKFVEPEDVAWSEIPAIIDQWLHAQTLTQEQTGKLQKFRDFFSQQWSVAFHLMLTELPFLSIFNPSQSPGPFAVPEIQHQRLAVHQRSLLTLRCQPGATILWESQATDINMSLSASGNECEVHFSTPGTKVVQASYTPSGTTKSLTIPFVLNVLENSGSHWVSRFQGSKELGTLDPAFRAKVSAFIVCLNNAGVFNGMSLEDIVISTYRPEERAYLMSQACEISRKGKSPDSIELRHPNVNISWVHYTNDGEPDLDASHQAATDMVTAYNIGSTGAAMRSNHILGKAIDMHIPLSATITVVNGHGNTVEVSNREDLKQLGRTFGVYRLKHSNHWSYDGT